MKIVLTAPVILIEFIYNTAIFAQPLPNTIHIERIPPMQHSLATLITSLTKKLSTIYHHSDEQVQVALWMLEELTHKSGAQLFASKSLELTHEQKEKLFDWILQHTEQQKPLQYIFGYVPFGDLTILVEPPVLIPRPETEEWVINLIEKLEPLKNKALTILDIGSGSGAIALMLAHKLPQARVYAIDIAEHALALGRKNAAHNNIKNIEFIHSDLFEAIPNLKVDLIVSNPPYIDDQEWKTLDPMVSTWEDKNALVATGDGLHLIQQIIAQAPAHLLHNQELFKCTQANLYIEIGYQQGIATKKLLEHAGYNNIHIVKDLEKKDRVACAYI